jgi:rhamnosyltransferase
MLNFRPQNKVIAVIVSFNGGAKIMKTIAALSRQVQLIHVVDNGSDQTSLLLLERAERDGSISLCRFGVNRGIGCALNAGLATARKLGFEWVLTMDQDSIAAPDMIASFARTVAGDARALCLSPNIVLHGESSVTHATGSVAYAITSGNLVNMEIYTAIGGYNEEYFIDCVDFDFSLRVRRAGYKILKDPAALLFHELGEKNNLPKLYKRYYALHSPLRRYYMVRNLLYLARKYMVSDFGFIFKLFLSHVILFVLLMFHDPKPLASLAMIFRGISDFFSGKVGVFVCRAN